MEPSVARLKFSKRAYTGLAVKAFFPQIWPFSVRPPSGPGLQAISGTPPRDHKRLNGWTAQGVTNCCDGFARKLRYRPSGIVAPIPLFVCDSVC